MVFASPPHALYRNLQAEALKNIGSFILKLKKIPSFLTMDKSNKYSQML